MYQKDYILRLIEQIGDLIRGILGLINKGKFEQARQKLDDLYYETLKEDAAFFSLIPVEKITQKLLIDHNYTNGHLELLAELLFAESELALATGHLSESLEYSRKSLTLLTFIDAEYKVYSQERLDKMHIIRERIRKLS
jgi:hypothetical protein